MIGFSDFNDAYYRVIRKGERPERGDALALWAGMGAASNSGASIDNKDYARGLAQAQEELYDQLGDGHDVDDMIDWTIKTDWAKKGLKEFEQWLENQARGKRAELLEIEEVRELLSVNAIKS